MQAVGTCWCLFPGLGIPSLFGIPNSGIGKGLVRSELLNSFLLVFSGRMAGCFHTFVLMLTYYFALGACYTAPISNQLDSVPEKVLTEHAQARVETLPGYPGKLPSAHYSGYLPIQNRQISPKVFYYLATSERDPRKDPLILILPGGPRCSSFSSFLYENGPFRPQAAPDAKGRLPQARQDGKDADDLDPKVSLKGNPFSWSKVASVLYIDTTTGKPISPFSTSPS